MWVGWCGEGVDADESCEVGVVVAVVEVGEGGVVVFGLAEEASFGGGVEFVGCAALATVGGVALAGDGGGRVGFDGDAGGALVVAEGPQVKPEALRTATVEPPAL